MEGTKGSRHILIGPNGAGKSNFIEIINHCFRKALFERTQFNESLLITQERGDYVAPDQLKSIIFRPGGQTDWNLRAHDGSGSDDQEIALSLELNDNDFKNLEFLLAHSTAMNKILELYAGVPNLVPTVAPANLRDCSTVQATIQYRRSGNQLNVTFQTEDDPRVKFIKSYLRHFPTFQAAVGIHNRYSRSATGPLWPELQQTFAMLGSYRNYAGISSSIGLDASRSFQPVFDRARGESTRSGGGEEPAAFDMVKRKVGYTFLELFDEASRENTLVKLYTIEPLVSINKLVGKYLDMQVRIKKLNKYDLSMEMYFERGGKRVDTQELSSGEKGILHFIFTLYGFDLQNGVVVIDEPELHLHPQIQKEYQAIMREVMEKLDIQFIVATHSPQFVDVSSISQVYRFFQHAGHTEIVNPTVTASQKSLTKILDLTNSAKIFFVNRAILVEGETDEYFLRFFLDHLKAHANDTTAEPWLRQIEDFEIFSIKGKGARTVWTEFLKGFGLQVCFIGDWDNIAEVANFDLAKYSAIYAASRATAGEAVQQKGSSDGVALFTAIHNVVSDPSPGNVNELGKLKDYVLARNTDYPKLIEHIKANEASEWRRLETAIDAGYANELFILKQGELEDYLGIRGKGLAHIIEFCQTRFGSWLADSSFATHRAELQSVLRRIFR